jgi:hypothetical protein
MIKIKSILIFFSICIFFLACSKSDEYVIDDGKNIRFVFDEGLNDDPNYKLPKDLNGRYYFILTKDNQNVQRISVRLLNGDKVVYNKSTGYRHNIEWKSNLYWWLLKGDTVANITKTYFNPFLGEIQYVNYPPLLNWKDVLVTTINGSSITNENSGRTSSVIAPIGKMKGDTMKIYIKFVHSITKSKPGSYFFEPIGERVITDSVLILLR